ncbi:tyrosine-type recombinase/integrase [Methanoregula sp. UBA64]|jgi:integrase|uniref:tyrosine-type recombinase/integrase n=1 Tax=Methanoregula sp. UBA64 TaxID=1915554 RepID=UPI0025F9EC12|nr:site-specific integrase [Methanoregula sp. UBA64]
MDSVKGKKIDNFIQNYTGTTRTGYRSSIYQFLNYKFKFSRERRNPTPEERTHYEEMAEIYLSSGEINVLKDLRGFKDWMFSDKRPPHSISQNIANVRVWLEHYGFEMSAKEVRELKKYLPRQRTAVTREDEVTGETIRTLLSHANPTLRAIILLMYSSGIRIGELVKLHLDDIDMEKNTIYISDLISKNRESRITFFTDEAKDALQIYLKERDRVMARAAKCTKQFGHIYRGGDEIFAGATSTIRQAFSKTLKRAAFYRADPRTGRGTIHPHILRKYFISTMKLQGCPDDVVEALAGHSGYLSTAYRRYPDSALREQYNKYSAALTIRDYGYERRKQLEDQVGTISDRHAILEQENTVLREKVIQLELLQHQIMTALQSDPQFKDKMIIGKENKRVIISTKTIV